MCKGHTWILMILLLPLLTACASKKVLYTAGGSLIGAGGGYAIDHDGKDAAIGGLVGGITGAVLADVQIKRENKKYQEGYDQGYTQAQLEIAINNWNDNTGRFSKDDYLKTYHRLRIPEKIINNVQYESHYETVEVYQ
ncbi:MAG: hypothetical protein KC733_00805 [Candidatus Omnitrophica bacterium]|nr:hypothetical protein [Candidatus Omnitrophota bacterium]